jgi:hypothetical protein
VRCRWLAALLLAALAVSPALAQDARMLGMGGVAVAGPSASSVNPAFAAVPGNGGTSLTLPLGALSAVTRDYWDPYSAGFDALSTLDQGSALGLYLLNPAASPDRVTVGVDANGLSVTFEGGATMRLADPTSFDGGLELPVGGAVGPLRFGVRPYLTLHARFQPGTDTRKVFETGSASASATLEADAEAGVALDVGTALPLPVPSAVLGGGRLYAGVRGSAIAGLAKASADLKGQIQAEQDSSGNYTGNVLYSYSGTLSQGGLLNGTVGYGAQAALGVAATVPSEIGTVTLGASVRHLGVMIWTVDQTRVQGDQASGSSTSLGTSQQVEWARHVTVDADVALAVPAANLGVPGMDLLLAADGTVDLSGGFAAHMGTELRFGPFAVRAGAGYQDGLRLGVGAGVRTGPVGLDVALTSHRSPFTDHQAYGVAASLGFGF